ncbi:MAG: heavy-metal-associated domain-containing protein [Prevotella sp.]|nr:heavy-metal-associated domain-containing protein [Prevotella sp.]
MKKIMTVTAMLVFAISMFAKDIKTVVFTTLPQMHCENCENKIKGNLRFEKGIKQITTSVPDQKVTIEYDADKTTPENIAKGFAKIGYEATVVTGEAKKKGCSGCSKKADATKGNCCKKNGEKKAGSCSEKAEVKKEGCGGCSKKADATKGNCCKKNGEKKEGNCCKKAEVKKEGCGGCSKKAEAVKGNCSTK